MSFLPDEFKKIGGTKLTLEKVAWLEEKYADAEYKPPKYLKFCRFALEHGYRVKLYEAQQTVSKYVTVFHGKLKYKIRFSNHAPGLIRELSQDCDFFVGITNLQTTTARDAWIAMQRYFKGKENL